MLNQDLRRSRINMHKTKIFGWLYYPFRVFISNIMECYLHVVGLVRPQNIQSSIMKILISLFPVLHISCQLFIFPKNSSCAGWWTCGFTFSLVLLYHDSDHLLPHSMSNHCFDNKFPGRWALDFTSIVL
jgi:hypothetical protein